MTTSAGRCLRTLPDRENWYLRLPVAHGRSCGLYLKRQRVRSWRSRLRAKLGAACGITAGRLEAQNVRSLTEAGIDVMVLAAYGQKLHADGLLESFVLTEELDNYTELNRFLCRRFAQGASLHTTTRQRDLCRLIRQVALIVRRLHTAGYNHRDLYCCHFLIREPSRGEFEIKVIDLQRVQFRRRRRRRWVVKDLAQLAFSAPPEQIKCTHKLAFMRHYLGVGKLRAGDKRLSRRVLCKQRLMERRLGREG